MNYDVRCLPPLFPTVTLFNGANFRVLDNACIFKVLILMLILKIELNYVLDWQDIVGCFVEGKKMIT